MNNIFKRIVLALIVLITLFSSLSFGATKQDVINAINASYYVSEEQPSFKLPEKYRNKGITYLNEHELTSKQYSQILAAINEGVAFAREVGHTHYKKYTKEQLNKALKIVSSACKAAGVDMNEEINKEQNSQKANNANSATNNTQKQNNSNTTNNNPSSTNSNTKNNSNTNANTNTNTNVDNGTKIDNKGSNNNKPSDQEAESGNIILTNDVINSGESVDIEENITEEELNILDIIPNDEPVDINFEINRNIAIVIAIIVLLIIVNILL